MAKKGSSTLGTLNGEFHKLSPYLLSTMQGMACLLTICALLERKFMSKNTATFARLSLLEKLTLRSHTWPISDFSFLTKETYSPIFPIEERPWKLCLYPRGNLTGQGRFISLYLYLDDATDLTGGRKLYIECVLSIRDQFSGSEHKKSDNEIN
ncbi:hypothetical protein Ancab_028427, partial [Ancistrocladus abbreviatus]